MKLLLRSMLFVPAYNKKFIDKAIESDADALILDMEDSVPEDQKAKARSVISEYVQKGVFENHTIFVRTNPLEDPQLLEDIKCAAHKDITGFMPPKISSEGDMQFLDKLLLQQEREHNLPEGHFKLAPLVETTASVLNLAQIVRHSSRTVAICFGGEDYLNDLQGTHGFPPKAFDTPRALVAMAARSVGIAPIDTPFLDLTDTEGFLDEKQEAWELGFAGTLLINPKQIELAHQCFTPSQKDISESSEIIAAIEESKRSGAGCVMLNKRMVGPPMQRRAERINEFMELIEAKKRKKQ